MDCVDMVLDELVSRIPTTPLLSAAASHDYWLAVGFWLNRLQDEAEQQRWVLQFALAIQSRWGLQLAFATHCVTDVMRQAAALNEAVGP